MSQYFLRSKGSTFAREPSSTSLESPRLNARGYSGSDKRQRR